MGTSVFYRVGPILVIMLCAVACLGISVWRPAATVVMSRCLTRPVRTGVRCSGSAAVPSLR